jgi:hypothetical protein
MKFPISPPMPFQPFLYRCIATLFFVSLIGFINVIHQFLPIATTSPTTNGRVRTVSQNEGDSSLQPTLPYQHTKSDNQSTATADDEYHIIQYCYNPTTINQTAYNEFFFKNTDAIPGTVPLINPQHQQQQQQQQKQQLSPKIVWLMSFPNSGTTYTLKYVQGSTMTTTATNYGGNEQVGYNTSISIYDSHPFGQYGPFFRYPDRTYSCDRILTKTHCHQMATSMSTSVEEFMNSCRLGNRNVNGTIEEIIYDTSIQVDSAIHLIRNPFDNIVARMHYKIKQWLVSTSHKEQELAKFITMTPEGLVHWCQYIHLTEHKKYTAYINSTFYITYMESTPCAIEFYNYFHWHHYATEGIRTTVLQNHSSMVLYYEDYITQYKSTTNQLLHFLQLQRSTNGGTPPDFILGKTYTHWFTNEMVTNVKRLALTIVSDATWDLLQHYFI